jgi:hypothetical protein
MNTRTKTWLAALGAVAMLGTQARAAVGNPSRLNIDVAVTASLSVSVNGVQSSTYVGVNWNTNNANQELVALASTTVTNDSNVVEKWNLSTNAQSINTLGNPEQWTLASSTSPALPGVDGFALQAVFGSSNTVAGGCPGVGASSWQNGTVAPLLTSALQQYTATRFADGTLTNAGGLSTPDVSASGNMVAATKRVLCWRIVTPSATTTTDTQNVQLIVTATP